MATLGITTDQNSSLAYTADQKLVSSAVAASSGVVSAGSTIVWANPSVQVYMKAVIYSDSSGPATLLATSDEISPTLTTSPSVQNFTFSGANQINIVSGTTYWIGIHFKDPGSAVYVIDCGTTANNTKYNADTYADGPATTFGAASDQQGKITVSIEYAPATDKFFQMF